MDHNQNNNEQGNGEQAFKPFDIQNVSDADLKTWFDSCKIWNQSSQWLTLGVAYHWRGYYDNAAYCFRKAEECAALEVIHAAYPIVMYQRGGEVTK